LGEQASVFTFPCKTIALDNDKLFKPQVNVFYRRVLAFSVAVHVIGYRTLFRLLLGYVLGFGCF
jgi:hypothetical protein